MNYLKEIYITKKGIKLINNKINELDDLILCTGEVLTSIEYESQVNILKQILENCNIINNEDLNRLK